MVGVPAQFLPRPTIDLSDHHFQAVLLGTPSAPYVFEILTNLHHLNWIPICTNQSDADGGIQFIDPAPHYTWPPERFYRARQQ
jgi:hypothetical protein